MSVVDRSDPEVSCSGWHGDGTAGGYDVGSHLAAAAPARVMSEARLGNASVVGKGRRSALALGEGPNPRHSICLAADSQLPIDEVGSSNRLNDRSNPPRIQGQFWHIGLVGFVPCCAVIPSMDLAIDIRDWPE